MNDTDMNAYNREESAFFNLLEGAWLMKRKTDEEIQKIRDYPDDTPIREIARDLWFARNTVAKYRKMQEDTAAEEANVLSWKEEQMWLEWKQKKETKKQKRLTKEEKQKLELLQHYSGKDVKELLDFVAKNTKREVEETLTEPWHLKFALVSDTHFWAKQCARDELKQFYEVARDEWVECFVHAGDIVDGTGVYHGQQFEQDRVWFEEQIADIKENYPNVWLPTYFIGGNHDEAYLKANWVNICKAIETVRQDLINLWFYDARLKLSWIDINLHHWGGSLSYAKDYKMKKYLDSLPVDNQPDIFALWHYHTALYDLHRGIHGFMPWAFLKENLLSKRFNLWNIIWGWLIEIEKDEDGTTRINMEFVRL